MHRRSQINGPCLHGASLADQDRPPLPIVHSDPQGPPMPDPITADCLADIRGVAHGFYTRAGGVSAGIYAGLNCGAGSNDDRDKVRENRGRVARHLGTTGERLLTCYQIHSADAVVVTQPWTPETMPRADALVTNTPGIAIGSPRRRLRTDPVCGPRGPRSGCDTRWLERRDRWRAGIDHYNHDGNWCKAQPYPGRLRPLYRTRSL